MDWTLVGMVPWMIAYVLAFFRARMYKRQGKGDRLALKEIRAMSGAPSRLEPEDRLRAIGLLVERQIGVPDKESFWRREEDAV